jgi:glycosyltransferase involved in cell wall biosynthesis
VERPFVSVLIPTRDRPTLVAGAVRSALEQEGVDVEVCVIDDGSSPPLVLPPDIAADERVTLLRFDRPGGAAAARNAALAATRADLVAFIDDDDEWLPGKLRRQVQALSEAGPGTVMVATGFELWDGERLLASVLPPPDLNSGGLLAHPCLCPTTALAWREAIVAAGSFDESLTAVEDWDLWLRMSDRGTVAVVPEVLADRRLHLVPPEVAFDVRRQIAARIEARLPELPAAEAARLWARFRLDDGALLAMLGRRRAAARVVLAAWRDHPGSRAAPLRLARALAGERAWGAARVLVEPARARLRRARRLPRPPGPAPRWAAR